MTKVPYAFQNAVRNVYFNLLKGFVEEAGLTLNLEDYKEDVILSGRDYLGGEIVAVIDSHSPWGEPNDVTNESTHRGLNGRTYDGLKITIKNYRYREQIDKFVDNMRRQLAEDVIVEDISDENTG